MPLEDKLAVLVAADAGLRTEPGVVLTPARFEALRVDKLFASTEGALCRQVLTECGGGLTAVAVDGDESQTRSFPASHGGHVAQAGYEHFLSLDLAGEAPRVSEEAVALLRAPACPPGRRTLILAGEQLGLQVHESIGHAVELDRVLGREASYAGTSFVPADGIGSLRVGSPLVNVTADAASRRRARLVPLGRRGRGGTGGADRALRRAGGLPVLARDGRRDRARALRRLHAGGRARAAADRADDEREPRARRGRARSRT